MEQVTQAAVHGGFQIDSVEVSLNQTRFQLPLPVAQQFSDLLKDAIAQAIAAKEMSHG